MSDYDSDCDNDSNSDNNSTNNDPDARFIVIRHGNHISYVEVNNISNFEINTRYTDDDEYYEVVIYHKRGNRDVSRYDILYDHEYDDIVRQFNCMLIN